MKPKILRTDTEVHMGENALKALARVAQVVTAPNNDEQILAQEAHDADLIIVSCFTKIPARVIESATKLKGILKYGVGVDNIDLKVATRRRVLVVNCPEYGAETIADHAVALMICLARRIIELDRTMREWAWLWPSAEYLGVVMFAKILGIIGLGRTGKAMARRASGFGMKQVVYDPYVEEAVIRH
jgi:D-3-phosphoglycerate dehydrogenase